MKFPFVSRERYADVAARLAAVEARYDALLVQYVDAVTPKAVIPKAVTDRDAVTAAIMERAKGDAGLMRHLGQYARAARGNGIPDDHILESIMVWQGNEDEGVPS